MDFHITETPTLHFVATGDEQQLSQDLQTRMEESIRQADQQAEVAAAVDENSAASARLERLKKAERTLHLYARESGIEMAHIAQRALDLIIESAADGKPEFAKLSELTAIESRSRQTGRALERKARRTPDSIGAGGTSAGRFTRATDAGTGDRDNCAATG